MGLCWASPCVARTLHAPPSVETGSEPTRDEAQLEGDGAEVGRTALTTASGPATLVATADRDRLHADETDIAYVAVELRDADGRLVTGDDRAVTVDISGAGVLAGMCSAEPRTTRRFHASAWRTFDGRALAVVRPSGAGRVAVQLASDGLDPVVVGLTVPASDE